MLCVDVDVCVCLHVCVVIYRGLDTLLTEQDLDTISSSTAGWSGSEMEVLSPIHARIQISTDSI